MGDVQNGAILNTAAVANADFVHVTADDGHGPDRAVFAHDHITDDHGVLIYPGPFTKLWCDTLVRTFAITYTCIYRVFPDVGGACGVGLSKTLRSHGWRSRAYRDVFTACFGKAYPTRTMHQHLISGNYPKHEPLRRGLMNNPLLTDDLLPKFGHIRTEHMETAIDQILSENRVKIAELAQQDDPTWDTLAQPMQALENKLSNAWSVISHLNGVMNNDDLRKVYKNCLEKLTEYSTEVSQNGALCEAYKKLAARYDFKELNEPQRKSIENVLRDFHLVGVDLPEYDKKRNADLSWELAELSNKLSDNVLDATQHWFKQITDVDELSGLPETAIEGAKQAARQKELDGYVITLDFPSFHPVMTHCNTPEFRRQLDEARVTRGSYPRPVAGTWDNTPVMAEILKRRHALAQLLGFDNYAERSLATKMARTTDEVLDFLNQLAAKSKPQAEKEFAELKAFVKDEQIGRAHV